MASGCGVRAHFTCIMEEDDWRLLGAEKCVQEHSEPVTKDAVRSEALDNAGSEQPSRVEERLVTSLAVERGYVMVSGLPERAPTSFTVTVRLPAREAPATCGVKLLADGEPLELRPLKRVAQGRWAHFHLAGDSDQLKRLTRAERFVGTVCGEYVEADRLEVTRLRAFAARFLEQRALASGATGTSAAAGADAGATPTPPAVAAE